MSEPIRDVDDKGNNNSAAETAAQVGAILGAAALEAARLAMMPPVVRAAENAVVGGAIAFGAIDALTKAAQTAEKVAPAVGGAVAGPVGAKVVSEVVSTPSDVKKHFQENPITASLELVISPISVVADAKFRKWFGGK